MLITGNPFSDLLTYLTLILPLLSVCFILFRKDLTDDASTLVMIICLFYFVQRLLVLYNNFFEVSSPIIQNVFNLVEFMLLIFLLKTSFPEPRVKYTLTSFCIAYFSSIVTFYMIQGYESDLFGLKVMQYGLTALLMVASIVFQARSRELEMMNTSLFWVTLGTLFYFSFCVFWEIGKKYVFAAEDIQSTELGIFPLIIMAVRFVFYALAELLSRPGNIEELHHETTSYFRDHFVIAEIHTEDLAFPQPFMIGGVTDYRSEKIL